MRCRVGFIIGISLLILLAACGECKTAEDCEPRNAFQASCEDKECKYDPIPGMCGNTQCETGENKCTCPQDCGPCAGPVKDSKYLTMECTPDNQHCLEDVNPANIKPIYSTAEQTSGGDRFKIDTVYNQPFNLKKDIISITLTLADQGSSNKDHHIQSMELTALTKDRRTITIAKQDVDKHLWSEGSLINEELILDFPTAEIESDLTSLNLKIQYEYTVVQGATKTIKQGTLQNKYRETLTFVNPTGEYPCPASCDDGNAGTRDYCGPQTKFFCKHDPIPGACGNYKCDGNENKCTCPQDCGTCSGSAGTFLEYTCKTNNCVAQLKSGVSVQPNSIFDDKSLGPVQFNNNYKYKTPFNIKTDKFDLDFKIYRKDPSVSEVMIETVRVLEGQQQLAEQEANKAITEDTTTISIGIPSMVEPEEERNLVIGVWYKYVQDGEDKRGNYQKALGKITLINPQ